MGIQSVDIVASLSSGDTPVYIGSYKSLADKPIINGVVVQGEKSLQDYGIASVQDIQDAQGAGISDEDILTNLDIEAIINSIVL